LSVFSSQASATGFGLLNQNASGIGNSFAGGAAAAEDASTIFFNPAGMTLLPGRQLVIAAHAIRPTGEFDDRGSLPAAGQPLGGDGGDPFRWSGVPNLYLSWALTDRVSVGLGVNVPFGLRTEYDADWAGRFQALLSDLKTLNVNPSVAFKITDRISIGAGVDYQTADATLTTATNLGAFGFGNSGTVRIEGKDHGSWGWNVGALASLGDDMRVGLAYRSTIRHRIEGNVRFSPSLAAFGRPDGPVFTEVELPDSASLSVFQRFDDRWDIMGDITWMGWSSFKQLDVFYDNGTRLQSTTQSWDDAWRFSLGLNYRFNDAWKMRTGVAYDQSPVSDRHRTARIPDNDRIWLSLGAQWKPMPNIAIELAYAHLFVKDATINDDQGAAGGVLRGTYEGSVDIIGAQVGLSF
jgi:long-chain fatty acid transport protein